MKAHDADTPAYVAYCKCGCGGLKFVEQARQALLCLAAVVAHPGRTSQELCEDTRLDRYVLARRLPELREAGKVRNGDNVRCSVTGRNAMTWWPA